MVTNKVTTHKGHGSRNVSQDGKKVCEDD